MISKINYEIVLSGAKNKSGARMVAIKATQGINEMLFESNVWINEENFVNGVICNHPMANKYNIYLYKFRNEIENIELDLITRGRNASLQTIAFVVKDNISSGIPIGEFVRAVMAKSDRQEATKSAYYMLVKSIEEFTGPETTIDDISYDWVIGFNDFCKQKGLKRNTIIGKHKMIRALIGEAMRRRLLPYEENPYLSYHIPQMTSRRGFLEDNELEELAKVKGLNPNEEHIRDAFLFCCYTGLRYSDIKTLSDATIKNGWIIKRMYKTKFDVNIPYAILFDGKAVDILKKYNNNVTIFSDIGDNGNVNRTIREVVAKTNIQKYVHWHMSRHTCATLLLRHGVPITSVKYILGHQKIETTLIYAEIDEKTVMADLFKIFSPKEGFDMSLITNIQSNSKTIWEERKHEMETRKEKKEKGAKTNNKR